MNADNNTDSGSTDRCILVGLDSSEGSQRALDFAADHAQEFGARLVLALIIEWSPYSFQTPQDNEERHGRRAQEIASAHDQVIDPALARLKSLGVEAEGLVHHGSVADMLNTLAAQSGASQIVVGRLGTSGLKPLVFGSVPCRLVQSASVPVTVVP